MNPHLKARSQTHLLRRADPTGSVELPGVDRRPQGYGSESDYAASEAIGGSHQLLTKTQLPDPEVQLLEQNILGLLEGYRLQMVEIGAAGRLLVSGEIERYFHWRTMNRSTRPTPSLSMERVRFDALKVQARQDAIVKNLLKGGSFDLMILGGDYDLSESVRRLGDAKCEYVRVTTGRFGNVAGN